MADPDFEHDQDNDELNWVSDEELQAAMEMEQRVFGRELAPSASKNLAKRLFAENSAKAAQSIIRTAIHGSTEKVRFDAAKYVLERTFGPTSLIGKQDSDEQQPLEAAIEQLIGNKKGPTDRS